MAQYTNASAQTVTSGANVLFTAETVSGAAAIIHRDGSGVVTLRGYTEQCRARFRVSFNGNVAIPDGGTAAPISVALTQQGEAMGGATAISTPAAAGDYNAICVTTFIDVPRGCCVPVGVRNLTDADISVQNASLIVERVC